MSLLMKTGGPGTIMTTGMSALIFNNKGVDTLTADLKKEVVQLEVQVELKYL